MKRLKSIIVSCTILISLNSCQVVIPRYNEIPRGEHCVILSQNAFCINDQINQEYDLKFSEMRGYEAVPLEYKERLELFMHDILEENTKLREACGNRCGGF